MHYLFKKDIYILNLNLGKFSLKRYWEILWERIHENNARKLIAFSNGFPILEISWDSILRILPGN